MYQKCDLPEAKWMACLRGEEREEGRGTHTALCYCLPWDAPSLWLLSVTDCCTWGPIDSHVRGGRCNNSVVYVTQTWTQGCVQHCESSCVECVQLGRCCSLARWCWSPEQLIRVGFCPLRSAFMLKPPLLAENTSDAACHRMSDVQKLEQTAALLHCFVLKGRLKRQPLQKVFPVIVHQVGSLTEFCHPAPDGSSVWHCHREKIIMTVAVSYI